MSVTQPRRLSWLLLGLLWLLRHLVIGLWRLLRWHLVKRLRRRLLISSRLSWCYWTVIISWCCWRLCHSWQTWRADKA